MALIKVNYPEDASTKDIDELMDTIQEFYTGPLTVEICGPVPSSKAIYYTGNDYVESLLTEEQLQELDEQGFVVKAIKPEERTYSHIDMVEAFVEGTRYIIKTLTNE